MKLHLFCELDPVITPLDPWCFRLDESTIVLFRKHRLINVWNHVGWLDERKTEAGSHHDIVLRE